LLVRQVETLLRGGEAREHPAAIEDADRRRGDGIQAEVVTVRPYAELRIIRKGGGPAECVTGPRTGRIRSLRYGDADEGTQRELTDDPAVGDLIVEHRPIAEIARLTRAAEAAPERVRRDGAEPDVPRRPAEDDDQRVDHLDVVAGPDVPVRVRRPAVGR